MQRAIYVPGTSRRSICFKTGSRWRFIGVASVIRKMARCPSLKELGLSAPRLVPISFVEDLPKF